MSIVDADRPRHGAGAPGGTGGQFAAKANTTPGDTLAESATGSFLFPPGGMATANELREFFTTTPVSDRVLSNAQHSYKKWRESEIWRIGFPILEKWNMDPANIERGKQAAAQDRADAKRFRRPVVDNHHKILMAEGEKMAREEAAKQLPPFQVPGQHMRVALAARQITWYRGVLPTDEEKAKVSQLALPLGDQTATVQEVTDFYQTSEWASRALTESDIAATDAMDRIADLLESQNAQYGEQ